VPCGPTSSPCTLVQQWSSRQDRRSWYIDFCAVDRSRTGSASRQGLLRNILRASDQVPSSRTNSGRFASATGCRSAAWTARTTRPGSAYSAGNTTKGCHCGSSSRASSAGSVSVRAQPKAKVSSMASATSHPVLLGLSGSRSLINRHTPARVGSKGRTAHRQWLSTSLQSPHRSRVHPPRATKGLVLRASRAARRRWTAYGRAFSWYGWASSVAPRSGRREADHFRFARPAQGQAAARMPGRRRGRRRVRGPATIVPCGRERVLKKSLEGCLTLDRTLRHNRGLR
jgi:hypothetical protein